MPAHRRRAPSRSFTPAVLTTDRCPFAYPIDCMRSGPPVRNFQAFAQARTIWSWASQTRLQNYLSADTPTRSPSNSILAQEAAGAAARWRSARQSATCPLPTGTFKDQQRDRTRTNLSTNLPEVLIYGVGVDRGHDDDGTDPAGGTDRAEQVGAVVTIVSDQVPFQPTRASSPNQISAGFPAASAGKASATISAKFF